MIDFVSARQRFAWQFLGYKRYLRREVLAHLKKEGLSFVKDSPLERAVLPDSKPSLQMQDSGDETPILDEGRIGVVDAFARVKSDAVPQIAIEPYSFEFGLFFDHERLSMFVFKEIDWAFVFPPLWYKQGHFSLFENSDEGLLLTKAFYYSNFKSWRFPLESAFLLEFKEAPRMKEERMVLPSRIRGVIVFMADFYAPILAKCLPDLPFYFVTHPSLAISSAEYKKKLWLQLLDLRGKVL